MGLLIIHVACACIFVIQIFGTDKRTGPTKVAQEVIADLKIFGLPNSQDLLDNPGPHLQPSPSAFTV